MRPGLPARAVGALDVAIGLGLLGRPGAIGPSSPGRSDALVVRVLGARSAAQGLAVLLRPSRRTLAAAGAIDLTHAASMLLLAGGLARYRRAALGSAALATLTGVLSLAAAPPTRAGR